MLVRVSYTRSTYINSFDEHQNRTTSHLDHEDWAEFMVVWRNHRIDLCEGYVRFHHIPLLLGSFLNLGTELTWKRMAYGS
jgi:hypothetical protein